MSITDIIRRSSRSLRSAKARTLLTASAIAVGTFALTLTLAASNGAQKFVNDIISDNFDPTELIVSNDETVFGRGDTSKPKEYDGSFGESVSNSGAPTQIKLLTQDDIAKIKQTKNVNQVREGVTLNLQYVTREGQKKYVATAEAFSPAQNPELLAGEIKKPLDSKRLLLPEGYLSALGFKNAQDAIGKEIIVAINKPVTQADILAKFSGRALPSTEQLSELQSKNVVEEQFKIAAVLKKPTTSQPGTELYLFIGNQDALKLNDIANKGTDKYRKYMFAYARVSNGEDENTLKAVQDDLKNQGYSTQSVKDTQKFLTQIIAVLQGIVAAFGAIAVIASVFGIVNTMYISVLQRTREIGLMKALGMRKRDIGRLFRFEAAWIGFLGGVFGSLFAIGLGKVLNPWISEKLQLGEGKYLLIFEYQQVIALIVVLMVISTLAGWLPSRKAAKLDPIEALRTE